MPNELVTSRLLGSIPRPVHSSEWHVMLAGQEFGPVSADTLIEMAETGKIHEDDLLMESGGTWIKACDAAILRRSFSTPETHEAGPASIENVLARLAPYHAYAPAAFLVVAVIVGVGIAIFGAMRPSNGLAGTTWQGSENLAKFGYLSFDFRSNGDVVMTDAMRHVNGPVHGKWSQSGNEVTITFTNCVYRGTLQGRAITGTATSDRFGPMWSFTVSRN